MLTLLSRNKSKKEWREASNLSKPSPAELKADDETIGGCYFSPKTMRFFGQKMSDFRTVYALDEENKCVIVLAGGSTKKYASESLSLWRHNNENPRRICSGSSVCSAEFSGVKLILRTNISTPGVKNCQIYCHISYLMDSQIIRNVNLVEVCTLYGIIYAIFYAI